MTTTDWDESEPAPETPRWRRWAIAAIAAVVALSMAAVQFWNLIDRGAPPIADSGLEICDYDYCEVQDAIRDAGLGIEMARLAAVFLDDDEARRLIADLIDELGVDPVEVEVVERLEGRTAGQYSPSTRTILLERPVRAWIVVHEVAHTVAGGHGNDFVIAVDRLVRFLEGREL